MHANLSCGSDWDRGEAWHGAASRFEFKNFCPGLEVDWVEVYRVYGGSEVCWAYVGLHVPVVGNVSEFSIYGKERKASIRCYIHGWPLLFLRVLRNLVCRLHEADIHGCHIIPGLACKLADASHPTKQINDVPSRSPRKETLAVDQYEQVDEILRQQHQIMVH